MTATTLTHQEWDKETGGLEVAKAFADQIRGKKGTSITVLFRWYVLTFEQSSSRAYLRSPSVLPLPSALLPNRLDS